MLTFVDTSGKLIAFHSIS